MSGSQLSSKCWHPLAGVSMRISRLRWHLAVHLLSVAAQERNPDHFRPRSHLSYGFPCRNNYCTVCDFQLSMLVPLSRSLSRMWQVHLTCIQNKRIVMVQLALPGTWDTANITLSISRALWVQGDFPCTFVHKWRNWDSGQSFAQCLTLMGNGSETNADLADCCNELSRWCGHLVLHVNVGSILGIWDFDVRLIVKPACERNITLVDYLWKVPLEDPRLETSCSAS